MAVNYHRKRDYTKQFDWAYELNNYLHKNYLYKSLYKRINRWDT